MCEELINLCLGRVKADLILKCKAQLSVQSGEILNDVNIAIKNGRIAYIGKNVNHMVHSDTKIVKIKEGIVVPGFIDAHTHIDLLCTPTEQAKMALIHGVTTLFTEPDELVSVMGFKGLKIFVNEVEKLPLRVYIMVPLTAPQDPKLSSARGMSLSAYKEALSWPNVVGLGEAVAWPLILNHDDYYVKKFKLSLESGKIVEGHTAGARDVKLAACVCSGISSCHEAINAEQALERLRLGLFLMIREGSLRRDLPSILPELIKLKVDLSNVAFVTDSVDPVDLRRWGYMDYIVKEAVEHGLDPVKAIQMVTINPARHFKVDDQLGVIAPGRYADIVVLRSLQNPEVLLTMVNGLILAENGRFRGRLKKPQYPKSAFKTMRVTGRLEPEDFKIKAPIPEGSIKAVVAKLESEAITRKIIEELEVADGEVKPSLKADIAKIAVVDRHYKSGRIGLGFIRGFGAKVGAVASSLNFDENQLVLIGYNDADMAWAANRVVKLGGGIILVNKGKHLEVLPMPIAGVISDRSLQAVARKLERINKVLAEAGCPFNKPLNVLLFITFVTLPEIRFTDKGIIDVKNRCFIPLFAS